MTRPRSGDGSAAAPRPLADVRDGLEDAVRAAGDAILQVVRGGSVRVGYKPGEGPVSEADHAADDVLHERLTPLLPGAHWLSEESVQHEPLVPGEPTWVIDPLDGTREFLRGLPEWGVSVALFADDRLVLGALALPLDGAVLSGLIDGERREARINGRPLPPLADGDTIGRVAVSRHDYEHRRIQRFLPFEMYPLGSAVLKLAHVADGTAGAYLATGPRSVWDVAGGAAVLSGVGAELWRVDGRPLDLSPQQVRIPPFVAATHDRAMAVIRGIEEAQPRR